MNTKHTPAPWQQRPLDATSLFPHNIVGADGFSVVARCHPARGQALGNVSNEECAANAQLIAAAPELLAMLQRLLGTCELNLDDMEPETRAAVADASALCAQFE